MGLIYDDGQGVQQDYKQAAKWFEKAAEQGVKEAQVALGAMCYEGRGVRRNHKQAKIWMGKACKNGYQMACDVFKKLK